MSEITCRLKVKHYCHDDDPISVSIPIDANMNFDLTRPAVECHIDISKDTEERTHVGICLEADDLQGFNGLDAEALAEFDHFDEECLSPKCRQCFMILCRDFAERLENHAANMDYKQFYNQCQTLDYQLFMCDKLKKFLPIGLTFRMPDPNCQLKDTFEDGHVSVESHIFTGQSSIVEHVQYEKIFHTPTTLFLNINFCVETKRQFSKTFSEVDNRSLLKWICSCIYEIACEENQFDPANLPSDMEPADVEMDGHRLEGIYISEITINTSNFHVYPTVLFD
jgi:hypothetical protein